jgi:hypothetical protein
VICAAVFAIALLSVSVAMADEVVRFTDGRFLEVARVEAVGETIRLELPGGGLLTVPGSRVVGWTRLVRPESRERVPTPPEADRTHAWRQAAGIFAEEIERAATEHRLDPILLTAVARTESAFDPAAVSPKGAGGLMQLMPSTAERFGVTDRFDASQNVRGGAKYLSWLLERFDGNTELALAGYNAGENAVDRYDGIPPYPETKNYVRKVMREAARLRRPVTGGANSEIPLSLVAPAVAD